MHFQLHDSDILAKASFPFTRSTFRAKSYLRRIKQKALYLHFKQKCLSFLEILGMPSETTTWPAFALFINPRETFTAGTY